MKKKILFIPFVILIVVALDLVNRAFCTYAFNHVPECSRVYFQHVYHLNQHESDVLIAGASNGMHSYIPSMINDSLNMSCFNSSQDGRNISFQYFCLKKSNEHHSVKIFILDLGEAQISDGWLGRTEYYQTYYWQNADAKDYINRVGDWTTPIKMLSSFLQYNNKFMVAVSNFLPIGKFSEDGYVPLAYTGQPFLDKRAPFEDNFSPAPLLIEYLDKIVSYCKNNNIRLIISASPRIAYSHKFIDYISDYCKTADIEFYNNIESIKDRTLYYDFVHLNDKGARLFTDNIIEYLRH